MPPRQVILISLDAARPDRFSCYGYGRRTSPEIDRLAAAGVVCHRHFAQATTTRASVPSMLYSRYYCASIFPNSPRVPYSHPADLFRRPDEMRISLPRALELAGFRTAAISAHSWTGNDTPFAAEFMETHNLTPRPENRKYGYPRADYVLNYAVRWLRKNHGQDVFLYIHLMDTHFPHFFDRDAQDFFAADRYAAGNFHEGGGPKNLAAPLTEDDRKYLDALYDGSLRFADRQIGRLVSWLRQQKPRAHPIIAITADHGENLLEGPGDPASDGASVLGHGGPWFERVARIPLIVYAPDRLRPGVFRHFSEGVDVAPTLLALAGEPLPPGKSFDGVDLGQIIAGKIPPKDRVLIRHGIRTEAHKCLFNRGDRVLLADPAPDPQQLDGRLYGLVSDPDERSNLFSSRPDLVRQLLARYRAGMTAPFQRFQAARTGQQPTSAFAIGAEHMLTGTPVPVARADDLATGWNRIRIARHGVLVARDSDQPLSISFAMPNGAYQLSVRMQGRATLEVNNVQRELQTADGMADFGSIQVKDETFRATIRPPASGLVAVYYVGFTPAGAQSKSPPEDERIERLRTLGYVE